MFSPPNGPNQCDGICAIYTPPTHTHTHTHTLIPPPFTSCHLTPISLSARCPPPSHIPHGHLRKGKGDWSKWQRGRIYAPVRQLTGPRRTRPDSVLRWKGWSSFKLPTKPLNKSYLGMIHEDIRRWRKKKKNTHSEYHLGGDLDVLTPLHSTKTRFIVNGLLPQESGFDRTLETMHFLVCVYCFKCGFEFVCVWCWLLALFLFTV